MIINFIIVIYCYFLSVIFCEIYHSLSDTPYPTSFKRFIKLTFLPYVIYKIIKKEEF